MDLPYAITEWRELLPRRRPQDKPWARSSGQQGPIPPEKSPFASARPDWGQTPRRRPVDDPWVVSKRQQGTPGPALRGNGVP